MKPSELSNPEASWTPSNTAALEPESQRAIQRCLAALRQHIRRSILWRGGALLLSSVVVIGFISFAADRLLRLSQPTRAVLLIAAVVLFAAGLWRFVLRPLSRRLTDTMLADLLERRFPGLQDRLRSAVDFLRSRAVDEERVSTPLRVPTDSTPASNVALSSGGAADASSAGTSSIDAPATDAEAVASVRGDPTTALSLAMKRHVAREAARAAAGLRTADAIRSRGVSRPLVFAGVALIVAVVAVATQFDTFQLWLGRNLFLSTAEWPYRTRLVVENLAEGETSLGIPRGDPLTLRVRVVGEIPRRVRIRIEYASDRQRFNLPRQGERLFLHEHPEVSEAFSFVVDGGDYRSPPYRVFVKERPRVEEISIRMEYPPHTLKPTETLSGALAEVAVPAGTVLHLQGAASKPLRRAWLESDDGRLPLETNAERFQGRYAPKNGGLVTVQLEDLERVPPDQLFRFVVDPVPDALPQVRSRTEGIGSMVTSVARIPLRVRATDDYAVVALGLAYNYGGDEPADGTGNGIGEDGAPPPEPVKGSVELLKLPEPTTPVEENLPWEIGALEIPVGERLQIRVSATDNDALTGPKTGFAAAHSFLVVTPERLAEEFLRREEELRRVLLKLIETEQGVRDEVYQMLAEPWRKEGALAEEIVRRMVVLSRSQRSLARRLGSLAEALVAIIEEMRNNKMSGTDDLARLTDRIVTPLQELSVEEVPDSESRLSSIREMTEMAERERAGLELATVLEEILARLTEIESNMRQLQGFTEIVNRVRSLLKTQGEAMQEANKARASELEDLFEFDDEPEEGTEGSANANDSKESTQ